MAEKSRADELRTQIAEVDRLRKWSHEAEAARNSIRCFLPLRLRWRDRALGFITPFGRGEFHAMPREVTDAVYQALAIVRDDYERKAAAIERQLNKPDPTSPDSGSTEEKNDD